MYIPIVLVDKRNADILNEEFKEDKKVQIVSFCVKYDKDTNWVCKFGPTKGRFKRGAMIVSNSTDGMSSTSA